MKAYVKMLLAMVMVTGVALAVVSLPSQSIRAAGPWYVKPGGNDGNDCLSPATACATINGALNKPGFVAGDTILVATGTYTGTGAEVVLLDKSATLSGGWNISFTVQSGMSTIDGGAARYGMNVNSDVIVSVERFAVQNAAYPYGIENYGTLTLTTCVVSGNMSTGISNSGTLTLADCAVSDNGSMGISNGASGILTLNNTSVSGHSASFGAGVGGLDNEGTVTLNNSTINGNTGGLRNSSPGVVTLNNSTVSGNIGSETTWGGIFNSGIITLSNSTISGNSVAYVGGGGISNYIGTVVMQNSIVAGNGNSASTSPDCIGTIGSAGYNLIGNTSGCSFSAATGDLTDVDARLGVLQGSPGYHPLHLSSPAINAGNPNGCTDHLGNLLTTDQRGMPRVERCDIGAYEYQGIFRQVFLPTVARNYCPNFFDDFSNPASGWPVGEDDFVLSEYLNGEYRVLSKNGEYIYVFRSPSCNRENYVVEVDARWVGTPGLSYGIVFGITPGLNQYYLFDVSADFGDFLLARRDPGGFTIIVPPTSSPAINGGGASNHLKVTRSGNQITLEVNRTVLGTWFDSGISGSTGAGVFSNPYIDPPISDARFDNFSIASLPGSSTAAQQTISPMAESSGDQSLQRRIDRGLRRGNTERGGR